MLVGVVTTSWCVPLERNDETNTQPLDHTEYPIFAKGSRRTLVSVLSVFRGLGITPLPF